MFASVGGDPSASRTVYGAVVVLALIGVAFIILAVWLYKSTRVDLSLLAPLETMSDRKWRRLDPASQRRLLDDERPEGARPLHVAPSAPDVDAEFESGVHAADGFDDLAERDVAPVVHDDTAPIDTAEPAESGGEDAPNDESADAAAGSSPTAEAEVVEVVESMAGAEPTGESEVSQSVAGAGPTGASKVVGADGVLNGQDPDVTQNDAVDTGVPSLDGSEPSEAGDPASDEADVVESPTIVLSGTGDDSGSASGEPSHEKSARSAT